MANVHWDPTCQLEVIFPELGPQSSRTNPKLTLCLLNHQRHSATTLHVRKLYASVHGLMFAWHFWRCCWTSCHRRPAPLALAFGYMLLVSSNTESHLGIAAIFHNHGLSLRAKAACIFSITPRGPRGRGDVTDSRRLCLRSPEQSVEGSTSRASLW